MKKRDGFGDFNNFAGETADEDAVNGGGFVVQGMEDELDVSILVDQVFTVAAIVVVHC